MLFSFRLPQYGPAVFVSSLLFSLLSSGTTQAGSMSIQGAVEITSSQFTGAVDVADIFDFSFEYDGDVTDQESNTRSGSFPDALTDFVLRGSVSNSGDWDPSEGSFTLPGDIQTSARHGALRFDATGEGFDDAENLRQRSCASHLT